MSARHRLLAGTASPSDQPPSDAGDQSDPAVALPLAERIALFGDDALVTSLECAAMRIVSDRVNQRERALGIGCPYIRISTRRVGYRYGDIKAFIRKSTVGRPA
jgi:hypothetical protein